MIDFDRPLKLRVVVARVGEMDAGASSEFNRQRRLDLCPISNALWERK